MDTADVKAAKTECPACGQSIEYPKEEGWREISCPTCNKAFTPNDERKRKVRTAAREIQLAGIDRKLENIRRNAGLFAFFAGICGLVSLLALVTGMGIAPHT